MKARYRSLMKICATALGAGTLMQTTNCNVQYPPDNTECIPYFGVCIAFAKEAPVPDDGFTGDAVAADAVGE